MSEGIVNICGIPRHMGCSYGMVSFFFLECVMEAGLSLWDIVN